MSQFFQINADNPQARLINQAVACLRSGGVIIYPTDSGYALGCCIGDKATIARVRQIRQLDPKHDLTLMCRDLSEVANYARVDNWAFRLIKSYTPGHYTFILKATSEVPRRLQHPKKKTIGLRIPQHNISLALLESMGEPLITTSLSVPGVDDELFADPYEIRDILARQVDLIIDGGFCSYEQTSIIDLTEGEPRVIREGAGDISAFIES